MFSVKFISRSLAVLSIIMSLQFTYAQKKLNAPVDFVNPFIGTGGHGHTFPGAAYPFGMMQLSPDTRLEGWDGCSGYHYSDSLIYGFSHTHLSGTGVPDYCDVLFMPGYGAFQFNNGKDGKEGYRSAFNKTSEHAQPGYYAVFLDKYQIQVELTVGKRTGIHHYQYPSSKGQWLLVDLKHRDPLIAAGFTKYQQNELGGYRISKAWADEQYVYFRTKFNKNIKEIKFSEDSLKIILFFEDNGSRDLYAQIGISAVDANGANKNLDSEFSKFNFKKLWKATEKRWNDMLSRIQIEDENKTEKIIFYTALYHNLIHPSLFQDVDGRYRGMDLKIHFTTDEDHFTVFSLWDTYRSTHPLYQLVYPEYNSKFIRTFLRQYQECGHLPVWELAGNETWCMIGNHSIPVIANAFHHRQLDFDTILAKEAITKTILNGTNTGMKFMRKGFISANDESESVSKTIENSVDFAAAHSIGCLSGTPYHPDAYKNLYNPQSGFFQSKLNNKFMEPFNPKEVNHHYTEANAYQYLFGAHHDIPGLMSLFILKRKNQSYEEMFRQRLDSLFMTESDMSGRLLPDVTGLIGQYAHGNEPSHHMAYLYDVAAPFQAQQMIQKIKHGFYKDAPDGLIGNEDCGQMSSWFVFSALGFYPVNPFDAHYYLGYPSFRKAIIQVPGKKPITIQTIQNGEAKQVNGFKINGKKENLRFQINSGDQLEFLIGNSNISPGNFKEIVSDSSGYVIKPYVKKGDRVFNDSTVVILASIQKLPIEYTYDTTSKKVYFFNDSLVIKENTNLFFRHRQMNNKNEWLMSSFTPKPKGMKLHLYTPYAAHYTGGGADALIDGLTGSEDYKDGLWQGYQGKDLTLTIELDQPKMVNHMGIRFIQDQPSWIMMPEEVTFWGSLDSLNFEKLNSVQNTTPKETEEKVIQEFSFDFNSSGIGAEKSNSKAVRFIKIQAKNPGKLPSWHRGAGGDSWLFTDEIILR